MKNVLKKGDTAPEINGTDLWEGEINVPAKDKWIYLSFHRFASCPFCNLRTHELIQQYDNFKNNNIEVLSIWPSDKERLLEFAGGEKAPFPMVSDKSRHIYKAYGVTASSFSGAIKLMLHPRLIYQAIKNTQKKIKVDADPKLMPASFLIDSKGIVQLAYYGKHFGDHPKIEYILSIKKAII